jgi:hypothetical protein
MTTTNAIYALRPNLPLLPDHMKALPVDSRGFPIPFFVAKLDDGTYDFRIADTEKRQRAVDRDLCWVCGNRLRRTYAFVVGPMCVCTGTTSEPACHIDCALFSAQACPFLTQPRMRRNANGLDDIGVVAAPGNHIMRNPGASAVYLTRGYRTFPVGRRHWLIKMNAPIRIHWFAHGRVASRAEVQASIDSGLPLLQAEARKERDSDGALAELAGCVTRMQAWLPAA